MNRGGWWSDILGLWVGPWDGRIDREPAAGTCTWLRFYDPEGHLAPLPEEAAQEQAQQAENRAEAS